MPKSNSGRTRRQREMQLDLALNSISQGLCMFDAQAKIVFCNRAFIDMYGLSPEVAKPGCTLLELLRHRRDVGVLAEDPEEYASEILDSIAKGKNAPRLFETPDGRFIYAINHPIPGGGWVTTHEEVTQRRLAELAVDAARAEAERAKADLQIAHRRMREAFEAVPEGLALFDADDRLVMWNRRYAEMYPETNNIVAGMRFEDVLWDGIANGQYPAARGREHEFVAQRLEQHNQSRSSVEQELPGGRWVRAEERRTADGGIVGVRINVTELKNREASFRLLFDRNPVPMWVFARRGFAFLAVNDATVAHYGYSREQFLAMTALNVRPPEDRDEFRKSVGLGLKSYNSGGWWRHVKADGSKIDVAIFAQALTYAGQDALLVAAIDVTERVQAEAGLRDAREFLNAVVENVPGLDHRQKRRGLALRSGQSLRRAIARRSTRRNSGEDRVRPARRAGRRFGYRQRSRRPGARRTDFYGRNQAGHAGERCTPGQQQAYRASDRRRSQVHRRSR